MAWTLAYQLDPGTFEVSKAGLFEEVQRKPTASPEANRAFLLELGTIHPGQRGYFLPRLCLFYSASGTARYSAQLAPGLFDPKRVLRAAAEPHQVCFTVSFRTGAAL